MRNLWSVARYTFTQCLRTKMAGAFILILVLVLGCLPLVLQGDGTLAGRIRTFLSYSTTLVALLLSLLTIFASAALISGDIETKRIFSLAVKPLSRWQYVVGKWLGVCLMDVLLLALISPGIYLMAQHLRGRSELLLNANDRRAVETEVFVARDKVAPDPLDIMPAVEQRIRRLRDEGLYDGALQSFTEKAQGDVDRAREMFMDEIKKQVTSKMQTAGPPLANTPSIPLTWWFRGIHVKGNEQRGTVRVLQIDPQRRAVRFQADPRFLAHVVYRGPVRLLNTEPRVFNVGRDFFDAVFSVEEMQAPGIGRLAVGQEVEAAVDPLIQITYKASAGSETESLLSLWVVTRPAKTKEQAATYYESRQDPVGLVTTLTVPARLVDDEGTLRVDYFNFGSPDKSIHPSVTILHSDMALLYPVGAFTANFVRAMLLVLLQLMFLAAVGVFAGSFVSFPVACLVAFTVVPFSMARTFLADAVRLGPSGGSLIEVAVFWIYQCVAALLPDLGRTSPSDRLVDGMYIPWTELGQTAVLTILVRVVIVLGVACLIFHKREVARVQV